MRIVLDTGSGERELVVAAEASDVTVGDVLAAAEVPAVAAVHVDGRRVPTDHTVAEAAIPDGATVALHDQPPRAALATDPRRRGPRLAVVAGAGAGASVALDRLVVVGRDPGCDLVVPSDTVSREHCRVVLDGRGAATVSDLGTTNGTWVGGQQAGRRGTTAAIGQVLRVGASVLRLEPPPDDDLPRGLDPLRNLASSGAVPFNRPPRPGAPPPVAPVEVPDEPPEVREAPPFNLAALLAPIAISAIMVVLLGNWRYAMFMALSPVLLLANWLSGRRRAGRDARAAERTHRDDLERFERELAAAADAERQRRWELSPSVAEVRRRAEQPSTRLWERRPHHADVLRLHAGVGAVPWDPPLATDSGPGAPAATGRPRSGAALAALERWTRLPRSPVTVDLTDGGVVGIVGEREAAAALARSLLLQACVHHGPADLPVAVVVDADRVGDWDWATWLPHTAERGGTRRLAAGRDQGRALLAALRSAGDHETGRGSGRGPHDEGAVSTLLMVLDAVEHLRGRDADARAVLRGAAGPVAGIVLAPSADQLPAVCDTIIELRSRDGEARLVRPLQRLAVDDLLVAPLAASTCRRLARRLAGLEDPEVTTAAAELPGRVDLVDLLPGDVTAAPGVTAAWQTTAGRSDLATAIGVGPDGIVELDLVRDGPHGLLGGTTGSGKSELLRSLVAGLAATHDPDHCTFVLVDYKGGAAFDACADLPHVVGLVTDLDEHLGQRALRCLEAELVHREQRLRAAGASDLPAWLRLPVPERGEPLPRLLVVIDEFATLKAELPEFVDALVGVAQRGRSLGVHLLLGTQRPSGAVDENVRANANLRIALRMTDERDSSDVVGVADAAAIPPTAPGRGLLRTGPREPVPLQTALVTGRSGHRGPRVRAGPVRFGRDDTPPAPPPPTGGDGPSDLERLVVACREAFTAGAHPVPRTPWPPALPSVVDLDALGPDGVPVPLGLLDDPDHQRQVAAGWDPAEGNLLVYGMVGSGTTTTLATTAVSAARSHGPDDLHLHVLDLGRGELQALAGLPHCGAVVTAREPERRQRLQAWLLAEADRRRHLTHAELAAEPLQVVVVDGLATWLGELDAPETYDEFEAVQRLVIDAPQLRMAFAGSVTRAGALRSAVSSAVAQRLVHRLADPNDYAALGLRPAEVPTLPPGRALRPHDGRHLQVATVGALAGAVAATTTATTTAEGAPARPPAAVATLPDALGWSQVAGAWEVADGRWQLPIGLDAVTLDPVTWSLHTGDHALVLGPPASGRTHLLSGLAALASGRVDVAVVGEDVTVAGPQAVRRVPPAELGQLLAELGARGRPTLVLVDDAEHVPDPGPALEQLVASGAPVRLVAAARQEAVQADYGHWLRRVARGRTGLFLRPTGDVPGDLLGARLPRRPPVAARPGRGWAVAGGEAAFVQAVGPAPPD